MNNYLTFLLCGLIVMLSGCGSRNTLLKSERDLTYMKAEIRYNKIVSWYKEDIEKSETNNQLDDYAIRSFVLKHADKGQRKILSSASDKRHYASYPFLTYKKDIDVVINNLHKHATRLALYESTKKCAMLRRKITATIDSLKGVKDYVMAHERYLQEQDKHDNTILVKAQTATLESVLASSQKRDDVYPVAEETPPVY